MSELPKQPKFRQGQRVRILPGQHYPATKAPGGIRYGIVTGLTENPGMHLINEDFRCNEAGEWAYIVASYHHPSTGAMWFSEKGIEPMKREKA